VWGIGGYNINYPLKGPVSSTMCHNALIFL
jgi:hypothetical protein